MIEIEDVAKSFVPHHQGGAVIPALRGAALSVAAGKCMALVRASGADQSTLMRMIYGNQAAPAGRILVGDMDIANVVPRHILALRRTTLGYVRQFLRVVPRVPTLDVVAEPMRAVGVPADAARTRAVALLAQLNIPERLRPLGSTSFSGGEQPRVNIARGFAFEYPALLLDEPTASLDAKDRAVVLDLILAAKACCVAIVGIFHDEYARNTVRDRAVDVSRLAPRAAA